MKTSKILYSLAAIALAQVSLQAVETNPVGFVSVTVKGNSDATIAVPLHRTSVFTGAIQSISGNVITVAGTPGWTAGQFIQTLPGQTNTYAVQIASGAKEGLTGKVTAHTTGLNPTLTVTLESGDDLTSIGTVAVPLDPDGAGPLTAQADQIDIMPYWTPSSLFSVAPPNSFLLAGFENAGPGINFGSSELYVHVGANSWEDGINGGDSSHAPLKFGSAIIARNSSATDYTATFVGAVPMTAARIRLSTVAGNQAQDQYIGYMAPIPEPLATPTNPNALGFPAQPGDMIQGFDNTIQGINQGAAELYIWTGAAWEDGINGGEIHTTAVTLKPGFGYIFQKAATPTPTSVVWSHLPGYLQ